MNLVVWLCEAETLEITAPEKPSSLRRVYLGVKQKDSSECSYWTNMKIPLNVLIEQEWRFVWMVLLNKHEDSSECSYQIPSHPVALTTVRPKVAVRVCPLKDGPDPKTNPGLARLELPTEGDNDRNEPCWLLKILSSLEKMHTHSDSSNNSGTVQCMKNCLYFQNIDVEQLA